MKHSFSLHLFALFCCLPLATRAQAPVTGNSNPGISQAPGFNSRALVFKSIIPPKLVSDMFGHRISQNYLAMQVTIFNTDNERDLLINDVSVDYGSLIQGMCAVRKHDEPSAPQAGVGQGINAVRQLEQVAKIRARADESDLQARMTQFVPTAVGRNMDETGEMAGPSFVCQTSGHELSILRGVAEKGQYMDPRNMTYRILQGVGTIGGALTGVAGLGPVLPKAVAAFNGPGIAAFTTVFPDFTVNQMNRLNDSAYAANAVIPKQRSKVMVAFIPLNLFFLNSEIREFRRDVFTKFMGDPKTGVGLKDLRVRVTFNYIVSTADIPPVLTAVNIPDAELHGFLDKTEVHGDIAGRFLEGTSVSLGNASGLGATIRPDPARASTDSRIFFVITPSKVVPSGSALDFEVLKERLAPVKISRPIAYATPSPALTGLSPLSGAKGHDVEVTLTGSNFYDNAPQMRVLKSGTSTPGFPVAKISIVNLTTATATFTLKDADPGKYDVRLSIGGTETGSQSFEVTP